MLGSIESDPYWCWAAFGKHPVAKDYFRLGPDLPLVRGFSDWVEKGYLGLGSKRNTGDGFCSWRFWSRGAGKDAFVCGLLRDSSDRLGRPYPLLIMGTGPLKDWEERWHLLPIACERTWNQIESISTRVFSDLKHMEDEIHRIKPPQPHWSEFIEVHKGLTETGVSGAEMGAIEDRVITMAKRSEIVIPLDEGPQNDYFRIIQLWHSLMKIHSKETLKAVFMGGDPSKTYLAFFRQPLVTADFIRLWFLHSVNL